MRTPFAQAASEAALATAVGEVAAHRLKTAGAAKEQVAAADKARAVAKSAALMLVEADAQVGRALALLLGTRRKKAAGNGAE